MNNFRVGMKVVCVNDGGWPQLTKGSVYTLLYVGPSRTDSETMVGTYAIEPQWYPWRFRPAVERGEETGMTILKKLLQPSEMENV